MTSEEYLSGHLSDVSAEYEIAGNKIKDWIAKGYIDKNALALTKEEAATQFYTGKGLIYFANNNELAALEENAAEAVSSWALWHSRRKREFLHCCITLV